jgi:hypothetical protein
MYITKKAGLPVGRAVRRKINRSRLKPAPDIFSFMATHGRELNSSRNPTFEIKFLFKSVKYNFYFPFTEESVISETI